MKKIISILLVIAICLSFSACATKNDKAYNLSKDVFSEISAAFEIMEQISGDIISAWTVGIYDTKALGYSDGFELFCNSVSLSEDDIWKGLAYYEYITDEYSEYSNPDFTFFNLDYYIEYLIENKSTFYFNSSYNNSGIIYKYDNVFTGCVMLVIYSYEQNGKIGEVEELLTSAELKIKQLSEKYSDYEHYSSLKEYYSTARSMFSFCQSPTGTLEQAKNNTNNYKNTADTCYNNLYYFFE